MLVTARQDSRVYFCYSQRPRIQSVFDPSVRGFGDFVPFPFDYSHDRPCNMKKVINYE